MIRIALNGAAGRMGAKLLEQIVGQEDLQVVAACENPASKLIGADIGELTPLSITGVKVTVEPTSPIDVMIDFSSPAGTVAAVSYCQAHQVAMVIGTTGHTLEQLERIESASAHIPILKAGNMSVGVNVLLGVVGEVAKALGLDYDCEIVECHHRFKVDAPSGTALALLDRVLQATQRTRDEHTVFGRSGETGQRPRGQVGVHAVRVGDTVGEHSVLFGSLGETITLSHSAHTRDIFAAGAVRAARWIIAQPPGFYGMHDVLFGAQATR